MVRFARLLAGFRRIFDSINLLESVLFRQAMCFQTLVKTNVCNSRVIKWGEGVLWNPER